MRLSVPTIHGSCPGKGQDIRSSAGFHAPPRGRRLCHGQSGSGQRDLARRRNGGILPLPVTAVQASLRDAPVGVQLPPESLLRMSPQGIVNRIAKLASAPRRRQPIFTLDSEIGGANPARLANGRQMPPDRPAWGNLRHAGSAWPGGAGGARRDTERRRAGICAPSFRVVAVVVPGRALRPRAPSRGRRDATSSGQGCSCAGRPW